MNQFANYAKYYDDVYQNKDYAAETDLIESVFSRFSKTPVKKILSLGCGTGTYEIELAKRGYIITGVDISAQMLEGAKSKIEQAGVGNKITLVEGDIRSLKNLGDFDAVIMMFNIVGYLHTPADLTAVAAGVASHLPSGGVFLFDAWYAPAVVADPPTDRTKVIEKNGSKITRITRGSLDSVKKLVNISFEVTEVKDGKSLAHVTEDHPMRYWDADEISAALATGGLKLLKTTAFDDLDHEANSEHWDMQVIAQKV